MGIAEGAGVDDAPVLHGSVEIDADQNAFAGNAQVIEERGPSEEAHLGSRVTVQEDGVRFGER